MHSESISLSRIFFERVKGFSQNKEGKFDAPKEYKLSVVQDILEILNGGFDKLKMREVFESSEGEDTYLPSHLLEKRGCSFKKEEIKRDKEELIQPFKFYTHPALQVVPPPPTIKINKDGTFDSSYDNEPFYLEIVSSFTLDDLLHYYYEKIGEGEAFNKERDKGGFKYLLKIIDLDTIMYAIDEATYDLEINEFDFIDNPMQLKKYIRKAKDKAEERKYLLKEGGLYGVIPR